MKAIIIIVAIYLVIGVISLIVDSISNYVSKRKNLIKRLISLYEQLKSNSGKDVAHLEREYHSLKRDKRKFSRKNRKLLDDCSCMLSKIIEESTVKFSTDIVTLRSLVDNQKVDQAFSLLQQLKLKRKTVSKCCHQYDKTLERMEVEVLALKEVQTSFDNEISKLQHFLELGNILQARMALSDTNKLIDNNPTYRNFDKLLLSQLQKEIEIKEQSRFQDRNGLYHI